LEKAGGFDEGFGLGFFDDDDLGLRVRRAGFSLLVALEVFVHHFGSRTFAGLKIDCDKQLRANFERFRGKWGDGHAARYRLPDGSPLLGGAASPPPMPATGSAPVRVVNGHAPPYRGTKALCMIVRDEESNLPDCLASARDLFDEVNVVDTGSTDRTREIAARFGARVFDFPWVESFAAARNESLRVATADWLFWLDADDRLDDANRAGLGELLGNLKDENAAYSVKCVCLPDPRSRTTTVVDHVRLFRNRPDVRWEFRVHEQILPALRRCEADVRFTDVAVHHTGYQDPALRRRKLERDLRLLRLEDRDRPDHPYTVFNLGSVYHELGRPAEALPLLRRSLERSHVNDSIVRKLYALIASCLSALGRPDEALACCAEGRGHYPDDAELLFVEASLREGQGDIEKAIACLRRLRRPEGGAHFGSVADGLRGHKAANNLAALLLRKGEAREAEQLWREALEERPDFTPSLLGLGNLLVSQARWAELEDVACRLDAAGAGVDASVLRARGLMARGAFPQARSLLEGAVAAAPGALWPRVVLSHCLLQEGRDPNAAERALLAVLELDPGNAEARHNQAVLKKGRELGRDAVFVGPVALAQLYDLACRTPSDIHEHLPTLYELARECRHVTELGTRTGVSTTAFLYAQPEVLVCYDVQRLPEVGRLEKLAGKTQFRFRQEDVLLAELEETDLLFIDTWHVYDQLTKELALHGGKARRYIVLHDTTTFGEVGESEGHRGLWPAVEEFLARGTFRLKARYQNNHGLAVLERLQGPPSP
jgi:tetratricopeptide (TPR) repeat protein